MPRVYRGLDIQWWMHAAGIIDQRYDEVDDIVRARTDIMTKVCLQRRMASRTPATRCQQLRRSIRRFAIEPERINDFPPQFLLHIGQGRCVLGATKDIVNFERVAQ